VLGRRNLVAGGESASSNDSPLRFEATTLGDRVVVMKDGAVQQVGEPLELYNQPANRFVPGFIGSPAMNFARVTVDEANGSLFAGNSGLRIKAFNGHEKRYLRETLFDRRVHSNYRRTRSRRPLSHCFDGKSVAPLISSLSLVFVSS
jgi:ABC-type proline/glycine betaine transport system ATPase subunit